MSPQVWNKRRAGVPEDAVDIQRPGPWGNPFPASRFGRGKCVRLHREMVMKDEALKQKIRKELRGKDLVCGCAPAACHGDVLLEVANE